MRKIAILLAFISCWSLGAQQRNPLTRGLADALYLSLAGGTISGNLTITGTCTGCGAGSVAWGAITGTLSGQTDLQNALNLKAPLASPSFTTPSLGVATATSVNKVTITAPASGATLTIADGVTLSVPSSATVSGTNTGDQTITLSGAVMGSGTGAITTTLANAGAGAGSCTNCSATIDAMGRVTAYSTGTSGGLATDGSQVGATAQIQHFTNGVQADNGVLTSGTVGTTNGQLKLFNTGGVRSFRLTASVPAAGDRTLDFDWSALSATRTWTIPNGNVNLTPLVTPTGSGNAVLATSPTITSPTINTGIPAGTGFQHQRAASCTTGITINATCDTVITWATAFADASYTAVVTLDAPTGGLVFVLNTKTKTATTLTVTLATLTAAASAGTINVIAVHD